MFMQGAPPSGPKFLHFHAVFGKNWPNNRLAPPPLGLAPPPLGNPGSATGFQSQVKTSTLPFSDFNSFISIYSELGVLFSLLNMSSHFLAVGCFTITGFSFLWIAHVSFFEDFVMFTLLWIFRFLLFRFFLLFSA